MPYPLTFGRTKDGRTEVASVQQLILAMEFFLIAILLRARVPLARAELRLKGRSHPY